MNQQINNDNKINILISYTCLCILGILITSSLNILIKLSELNNIALAIYRILIANILILIPSLIFDKKIIIKHKQHYPWLIFIGILYGLNSVCFFIALDTTSLSNVAILSNLVPFFILIFAFLYFKKIPTSFTILSICLIMTISGIAMIQAGSFKIKLIYIFGDVLSLAVSALFAFYIFQIKRITIYNTNTVIFITNLGALTLLIPLAFLYQSSNNIEAYVPLNFREQLIVFCIGSFHLIGNFLILISLRYLPPILVTGLLLLNPIFVTIFDIIFFNNQGSFIQYLGIITILSSIFLIQFTTSNINNQQAKREFTIKQQRRRKLRKILKIRARRDKREKKHLAH